MTAVFLSCWLYHSFYQAVDLGVDEVDEVVSSFEEIVSPYNDKSSPHTLLVTKETLNTLVGFKDLTQPDIDELWSLLILKTPHVDTPNSFDTSSSSPGPSTISLTDSELPPNRGSLLSVSGIIYLVGSGLLLLSFGAVIFLFWHSGMGIALMALCYGLLFQMIANSLLNKAGIQTIGGLLWLVPVFCCPVMLMGLMKALGWWTFMGTVKRLEKLNLGTGRISVNNSLVFSFH